MKVEFAIRPAIGTALAIGGQRFDLVRFDPHTKLDGSEIELAVWHGNCADCDAGFLTKCPILQLPSGRRCDAHKQPLKRVRP